MSSHPIRKPGNAGGEVLRADGYPPTILLAIQHEANRDRIKHWLSEQYDVRELTDGRDLEQPSYDLCIIDTEVFRRYRRELKSGNRGDQLGFLPVLLLSSDDVSTIESGAWALADEVVTTPTRKRMLSRRIENLLDRRRLSKRLREELDQTESLFEKVFENSSDTICIVDYSLGTIVDCNEAATALLGYPRAELRSLSMEELHPQPERVQKFMDRVVEQGSVDSEELTCETRDGAELPVEVSSSFIDLWDRPCLVNNIRDISDRKEREQRRRTSERFRTRLYEITSDPDLTFDEQIDNLLRLGRERLEVENGHLVHIDPSAGDHEVVAANGTGIIAEGARFDLANTYCRRTISEESALAIHDVATQGWADDPAYTTYGLGCYVGAKVIVDEEIYGTVCFVDRGPRGTQISEDEKTFIELIARWLGHELERTAHHDILRNLHEVTVELLQARSMTEVARISTDAIERVFDFEIGGVRLLDESGTELRLEALTERTGELVGDDPAPYAVGEGVIGQAFQENRPNLVEDLQAIETPIDYGPIRSAMCFPLDSYGTLSIGSTEVDAFDHEDIERVGILATNVAAALDRVEREQSLREAHEYRSKLFHNATDCIVEAEFNDGGPVIRDVNASFEAVFGYDAEAIRGKRIQEVIVPASKSTEAQSYIDRALSGERFEAEGRRETIDGLRDFLIRVVPVVEDGQVTGAYAVYTDITGRKRREQQVQVLNRILRHNLRNKVNVIHGRATQLAEQLDGEAAAAAKAIEEAAENLINIAEKTAPLRNLINSDTVPRPVAGVGNRDNRPVEVDDLLDALRARYDDVAEGVEVAFQSDVNAQIEHLNKPLEVALCELIDNAIDHVDRPTPRITVTVTDNTEAQGWVDFCVSDNGPGIPVDEIEVLESGEETPLHHSTGLGLWIVTWLVRGAGGEITFDVNGAEGSTVTLSIPTRTDRGVLHQPLLSQVEGPNHD